MDTVEFAIEYHASLDDVHTAFWRLEDWPALAEHVTGISLHYEDEHVQVLTMEVSSRGKRNSFKSVRAKVGDHIYYYQPAPPPFLRQHYGYWHFEELAHHVTRVTSRHYFEVVPEQATLFISNVLGVMEPKAPGPHIAELLRNNSKQTMLALKQSLERNAILEAAAQGVSHA